MNSNFFDTIYGVMESSVEDTYMSIQLYHTKLESIISRIIDLQGHAFEQSRLLEQVKIMITSFLTEINDIDESEFNDDSLIGREINEVYVRLIKMVSSFINYATNKITAIPEEELWKDGSDDISRGKEAAIAKFRKAIGDINRMQRFLEKENQPITTMENFFDML